MMQTPKRLKRSTEPTDSPSIGEFLPPDSKGSQVWRVFGKVKLFLNWNVFSFW